MRYDDSRFETAAAHWELACGYLEGSEGLPRDLRLAQRHLDRAFEHHRDLDAINVGTGKSYAAGPILGRLSREAALVLERALAGGSDYKRAIKMLKELPRLIELSAPEVIIRDHQRALRRVIDRLCPLPTEDVIERMGTEPLSDELELLEQTLRKVSGALAAARREHRRRQPSSR